MSTSSQRCSNCGKQGKLLQCSRCKSQYYCSTTCQTTHWPSHRPICHPPPYTLRIDLHPTTITNPRIWRVLSCPSRATFADLHTALQTAFSYSASHTFDFKIRDPHAPATDPPSLEEYIKHVYDPDDPQSDNHANIPSRRQKERAAGPRQNLLRITDTLSSTHELMRQNSRAHPLTPEVRAEMTTLHKVFSHNEYADALVEYEYDFGDSWVHTVRVVGREIPDDAKERDRFVCLDGSGHGVAENVGGVEGWMRLLEAYRTEKPNADQRDRREWFERLASNADPRGLGSGRERVFDVREVNERLARLL